MSAKSKAKKPLPDDDDGDDGSDLRGGEEDAVADAPAEDRKSRSKKSDRSAKSAEQWNKIAEDRKKGKRRIDAVMDELGNEDGDVYDEVTDDAYKRLVAARREDDSFVEDDGVGGYADDGEELFDNDDAADRSTKKKSSEGKRVKKKKKTGLPTEPVAKSGAIIAMFQRSGKLGGASKTVSKEESAKEKADLEDMLATLSKDDAAEDKPKAKKAADDLERAMFAGADEVEYTGDRSFTDDSFYHENEEDRFAKQYGDVAAPTTKAVAAAGASKQAVASKPANKFDIRGFDTKTASAAAASTIRIAPQMMDDADADAGLSNVSWDAVSAQTSGIEAAPALASSVPVASAASSSASAAAALKNGVLTMYWFDAYEDPYNNPGTVYVFGKALIPDSTAAGVTSPTPTGGKPATAAAAPAKPTPGGPISGDKMRTESVAIRVGPINRSVYFLPRPYKLASAKDENSVTDLAVNEKDVFAEADALLKALGVTKTRTRVVSKKYCFEQDRTEDGSPSIPTEAKYLHVMYDAKYPALPIDARGKTFSRVFGTRASALELFLLERDLMGPCWLTVKDCVVPTAGQFSYCKYDFDVKTATAVSVMADAPSAPPFKVLSLSIKTVLNPKTHRNELVMASGLLHQAVSIDGATADQNKLTSFTVARPPEGVNWPYDLKQYVAGEAKKNGGKVKLHMTPNEASLLGFLCAQLHKLDPDVLVGHELHGYTLEVLLQRMNVRNTQQWAKLGRLKKTKMPPMSAKGGFTLIDRGALTGRLLLDSRVSAQELIHEKTYTLQHLAASQLKAKRKDVDISKIPAMFGSTQNVYALVESNCNDAYLSLQLSHKLQVLPLTKQLTNLCGNLWANSLRSKRADRVEFLLLHEFHRLGFITPEKLSGQEKKDKAKARKKGAKAAAKNADGSANSAVMMDDDDDDDETETNTSKKRRKKAQYSGGLVLEPKKGFYDKFVLLLDFNSLYPSIIREFNVCFTTVKHWNVMSGQISELPDASTPGVLPNVVKVLLERRRDVKRMAKKEPNAAKRQELDIRQKALKLVANSMYGCLGFTNSRFFCEPLASLITSQGRDILARTQEQTQSLNYNVIYGDTDSIMVYTNETDLEKVKQIGGNIKKAVNKRFKFLEIDIDGIFASMLLLKKKKYAALSVDEAREPGPDGKTAYTTHREVKGLDLVRRDWCQLSKDVGHYVLDQILSGKNREEVVENIHAHLRKVRDDIKDGKVPLSKFIITKGLTKALADYPDAKSQPHVLVGQWLESKGKPVRVGEHVPYIICEDKDKPSVSMRAHHPDEMTETPAAGASPLVVDTNWYLSSQVLPPVARLCAPMEETNAGQMADCLGLDPKQFQSYNTTHAARAEDEEEELIVDAHQNDEERFRRCQKLEITCQKCQHRWVFSGVFDFPRSTRANITATASTPTATATPTGLAPSQSLSSTPTGDSKDISAAAAAAASAGGPVVAIPMPAISGLQCPTRGCTGLASSPHDAMVVSRELIRQITYDLRGLIALFYEGTMSCDDPSCGRRTRWMTVRASSSGGVACLAPKCQGKMYQRYSSAELYTQLIYYSSLFDVAHARDALQIENKRRRDAALTSLTTAPLPQLTPVVSALHNEVFGNVRTFVDAILDHNAYGFVSLGPIFNSLLS